MGGERKVQPIAAKEGNVVEHDENKNQTQAEPHPALVARAPWRSRAAIQKATPGQDQIAPGQDRESTIDD